MTEQEVVLRPASKRSHVTDSRRSSIFALALEEENGCLAQIFACRHNLASERGKRLQTIHIWILCSVSLVAILIVAVVDVQHYTNEEFNSRQSRTAVKQWECIDPILHYLALEGALDAYLRVVFESINRTSSPNSSIIVSNATNFTMPRESTTVAFVSALPSTPPPFTLPTVLLDTLYIFYNYTDNAIANSCLDNLFSDSVSSENISSIRSEEVITRLVEHRNVSLYDSLNRDPSFYEVLRKLLIRNASAEHVTSGYLALHSTRSNMASEMELATLCFGHPDSIPTDVIVALAAFQDSGNTLLRFAADVDSEVSARAKDGSLLTILGEELYSTRSALREMCETSMLPHNFTFEVYFDAMCRVLDFLQAVNEDVLAKTLQAADQRLTSMRARLAVEIVATLCVVSFFPLVLNSVGNMAGWIHDYAQRLRDRTEELRQEKKTTETLLYQLLPRRVANQIRARQQVCAESFDAVTIFFSDIVGFTRISAHINPIEVVAMLNDLYSCFDSRIDVYDVYKVETIGDAYMVASGCPERNGDKHVKEIATMSIDLRSAVKQVHVPRSPQVKLQVRIGIHTGPCVAGVVGIKMPRYCLFGDTVNTASRMESNGLPNKIHLSGETYSALCIDETYVIEKRGEVQIKGKGLMTTYWLIARQDYSEVNDSAVCNWKPRRKKKVALDAGSQELSTFAENSSAATSTVGLQASDSANGTPTSVKRLPRIPGQVVDEGEVAIPLDTSSNV